MIDSKVVLFEIEKGEIPNLTWTQDDATKNIWSAPYTLVNGMSDIATLNDSTMNGYFKCATEADLAKNIFSVKLDKNYVFDLPEADDTVAEVVAYLKAQTYSSTAQTWTIGGTGSDVVFTSTEPALAGPLGYSLYTECPAGNISSSIHTTTNGVRGDSISYELITMTMTMPNSVINTLNAQYISLWDEYLSSKGYSEWDISTPYTTDEIVVYNRFCYRCVSSNTGYYPGNRTYWARTFEEPYHYNDMTIILRDKILVVPIMNLYFSSDGEGIGARPWPAFHGGNVYYNFFYCLNNVTNPPRTDEGGGYEYEKYSYIRVLDTFFPYQYISSDGLYTQKTLDLSHYLSTLNYGAQVPIGSYSQLDCIWQGRQEKHIGALGFVDSSSIGLTATVICTQEGGSQDITPVHEVETLTIESVSDDYRLFFYDPIVSSLKVRLPYGSDPSDLDWNFAIKKGFSNFEGYWNPLSLESPLFYEGRIQSVPNITYSKDSSYYSIVSFDGGSITLNNTDGLFDNLDSDDVYGQICTLRYSYDSGLTWSTVYTGSFESYQLNGIPGQCIVNVYDKRKALSMSLPPNSYSTSVYPYLNTNNDGLVIPLAFGDINRAPVVCLNETEVPIPTDYVFKCCDTSNLPIESIDAVYIEGVEVTPENIDLAEATFTLSSTVYTAGKAVSADLHGYVLDGTLLQHPIYILEYILSTYLGIQKNSFNFNLTQWNLARDKPGIPDIGYLINSTSSIIDIIGEISNSVFGTFLIQKDGLITFKIRDVTGDPVLTIRVDDQLQAPVQDYKSDEYMNVMRVGYRKAHTNGRFSWITIDTDKQALHDKYRVDATKEVQTLLVSKAAATTYGNSLYTQFAGIFPTFTIVTKSIPPHTSLELEDLIEVETYINPDGSKGTVILELLGVDMDLNTSQLVLTGRYVRDSASIQPGRRLIKWIAGS